MRRALKLDERQRPRRFEPLCVAEERGQVQALPNPLERRAVRAERYRCVRRVRREVEERHAREIRAALERAPSHLGERRPREQRHLPVNEGDRVFDLIGEYVAGCLREGGRRATGSAWNRLQRNPTRVSKRHVGIPRGDELRSAVHREPRHVRDQRLLARRPVDGNEVLREGGELPAVDRDGRRRPAVLLHPLYEGVEIGELHGKSHAKGGARVRQISR